MPYVAPATVATGTTIATAWGNSVKAATDYLANPPACNIYRTTAQSIPSATVTAVTFDAERFDNAAMHNTVTNTSRVTIPHAGVYVVTATVGFVTNGTGQRVGWLATAGVASNRIAQAATGAYAADTVDFCISTVYKFAANDFVELYLYQASGVALNTNIQYATSISATWVGLG